MKKVWTKECRREYMKNWRKKNSAHIQNYFQQWRLRNRDHMKYLLQNWREKNPEKVKKHWKTLKQEKCRQRWHKEKIYRDPQFHLDKIIGTAIYIALKGKKAERNWESLVGYTIEDLMKHFESKFESWMTWDNYGEWVIDHIKPKSLFKYKTAEDPEFKKCWALKNLQPLEKITNIKKSNHFQL